MNAYKKFAALGIYTPMDLSRWVQNYGFLDVHIVYLSSRFDVKGWQVRRLFRYSDEQKREWKIFPALSGKNQAEELAKSWASAKYGVDCWCRIEGMGNVLFPLAVAQYVKEQVGVSYRKRRQHSKE